MSSETLSQELRGAPVAKAITEKLAAQVKELRAQGVTPKLVIVRIGQKSDDLTYERAAYTRAEKVGFEVETIELPEDATQEQVNATLPMHCCMVVCLCVLFLLELTSMKRFSI